MLLSVKLWTISVSMKKLVTYAKIQKLSENFVLREEKG